MHNRRPSQHVTYTVIVGSGESGKSTILKQMKIINQNGYSKEELRSWRIIVYRNLIESVQAITQAISVLGLNFENQLNNVRYFYWFFFSVFDFGLLKFIT